ncbi:MAG: IPTL-CTERM sorting domain-containing protein, partial [Xanthomonadales bacterium]|nr:IPTL-CTERM sorting domain-containing protein [Xanthomonadales bacterium]
APGDVVTLTATGLTLGEDCVVTEAVPGGYFDEYSQDCEVADVVSGTTYACDIINGASFATFQVYKLFTDGNYETPVTIKMQCNNGLPTQQEVTLVPPEEPGRGDFTVDFVVTKFGPGVMDCTIWEDDVTGYTPSYVCGNIGASTQCDTGDDSPLDDFGVGPCEFLDVDTDNDAGPAVHFCTIRNYPDPATITVNKEWIYPTTGGQDVEQVVDVTLHCDTPLEPIGQQTQVFNSVGYSNTQRIVGDGAASWSVRPTIYPANSCYATENVWNSYIERDDDGCGSLEVTAGGSDECTFTNTVFFEGIPTLSQWGMALMALLMLGVGLVGFRRFA